MSNNLDQTRICPYCGGDVNLYEFPLHMIQCSLSALMESTGGALGTPLMTPLGTPLRTLIESQNIEPSALQDESLSIGIESAFRTPRFYYAVNNEERTNIDSPALTSLIERFMNVLETNNQVDNPVLWMRLQYGDDDYEFNNLVGDLIGKVEVGLKKDDIDKVSELCEKFDDKCPICLEHYYELECETRKLNCGHCYCDACITYWLSKHKRCPCCQIDLEEMFLVEKIENDIVII